MAQRNPMNDRYRGDGPAGKTRRSASAAKPKRSSSSSSGSRDMSRLSAREQAIARREQAKARRRAAASARAAAPMVVPTTPEFKRYRKIWWAFLGAGVVLTAITWAMRSLVSEDLTWASYAILGLAYACIAAALYIDFKRLRPLRLEAQKQAAADKARASK